MLLQVEAPPSDVVATVNDDGDVHLAICNKDNTLSIHTYSTCLSKLPKTLQLCPVWFKFMIFKLTYSL